MEVSESSRRLDLRRKPPIYAGAGVPLYWVIDIGRREVIVHADPRDETTPHYESIDVGTPIGTVGVLGIAAVADFLP